MDEQAAIIERMSRWAAYRWQPPAQGSRIQPERNREARRSLLANIRDRIALDLDSPKFAMQGGYFAPVISLAVKRDGHDPWLPQGIASEATPVEELLPRGTHMLFQLRVASEYDRGTFFHVDPDGSSSPSGQFELGYGDVLIYDLFGLNLAEAVLVPSTEPVLADPHSLDLIGSDIARLIADAPAIALDWR